MPWPHEMYAVCFDGLRLQWPYPDKDWFVNKKPLEAMGIVRRTVDLFSKNIANWSGNDKDFHAWIHGETRSIH